MDGFSILGLGNYTSLIKDIQVKDWGKTGLIDCIYNSTERLGYRIVFSDCSEIRWFVDSKEEKDCIDQENILDIVDFQIKKECDKQKAVIFARVVEVLITCKKITIEKNW